MFKVCLSLLLADCADLIPAMKNIFSFFIIHSALSSHPQEILDNCYNFFLDDKKELGAARRSQYYMKYGNPNYGGMKGILSNSW